MFGDRWQGWKCDQACRATLETALPAALLSAVGSELADSEAVQTTILAIQELFKRSVSFTRIARFLRQLHAPNSPLSSLSSSSGNSWPSETELKLMDFSRTTNWLLDQLAIREAEEFGLGQEAIERVINHLNEYQGPHEFPSPTPPSTEFDYFDLVPSRNEVPMEEYEHYIRSELDSEDITRTSERGREELQRTYRPEQDLYDSEASSLEEPSTPEEMESYRRYDPGEGPPREGPPNEEGGPREEGSPSE